MIFDKCYIAGKISGLPPDVSSVLFAIASIEVAQMGFEAISPLDLPHKHGGTWEEYMREDLMKLLECKYLYALTNWTQSPGARFEVHAALTLGIEVIFQPKFKSRVEFITEEN